MSKILSIIGVCLAFLFSSVGLTNEDAAIQKAAGKTELKTSQNGNNILVASLSSDDSIKEKQHRRARRGGRRGGMQSG